MVKRMMPLMTSKYISYLIRMWGSDESLREGCFASLEDPHTKKILYFRSAEALFAFLREDFFTDDNEKFQKEDT